MQHACTPVFLPCEGVMVEEYHEVQEKGTAVELSNLLGQITLMVPGHEESLSLL